MPIYESNLFYAMVAHDAAIVLPQRVRNIVHSQFWPDDLNKRHALGSNAPRKTARVMEALHPVYEDSVLTLISPSSDPNDHLFDLESNTGNLIELVVKATSLCKQSLHPFMAGQGGWEIALRSMGQLVHRLVDIWNPFNLQEDDRMSDLRQRFMNDLQIHAYELPFWWTAGEDAEDVIRETPYMDRMATHVEATRRRDRMLKPLADRYIIGNGWPAAEGMIKEWYNVTVNAIARSFLFCAA